MEVGGWEREKESRGRVITEKHGKRDSEREVEWENKKEREK